MQISSVFSQISFCTILIVVDNGLACVTCDSNGIVDFFRLRLAESMYGSWKLINIANVCWRSMPMSRKCLECVVKQMYAQRAIGDGQKVFAQLSLASFTSACLGFLRTCDQP